jgi:hypothetical protein
MAEAVASRAMLAYDHIDLTAAAAGADQPLSPIGHLRCRAVPLGHLGGVGLDLMPAIFAPNDQPDAGGGSIAERHRRAYFGFHGDRSASIAPITALRPSAVGSAPNAMPRSFLIAIRDQL